MMDFTVLIRRALGGEALSEEEKQFLLSSPAPPLPTDGELERLQEAARVAGEERDCARHELDTLKFRRQVERTATEYNFTDPDYLEYLAQGRRDCFVGEEQTAAFMAELRESAPRFFKVDLRPGPDPAPVHSANSPSGGSILSMLAEAPEVRR